MARYCFGKDPVYVLFARNARNHADHGRSVACGVRADGFEDRIEVDWRPNRCRVAQIVVKDGGDCDGDPRGHDGSGMVLVVDDDAAMRRWKARFVRSDYGSKFFASAQDSLRRTHPNLPGCLVLMQGSRA